MTNDFDKFTEDDFRDLIDEVKAAGDVPEPSPLFWNHLSARVRDAVCDEPLPGPWWMAYWRPVLLATGAVAALAMMVMLRTSAMPAPAATELAIAATSYELAADVEVSEMWRLIEAASPTMEMQSVQDAGLMPTQYATDQAIQSLTLAQREALVRLLRREMGVSE